MSEQLKQQTLYNVSEANTKNLIWVDVYISGAEGSAGTYASRRMTKAQLITFLNSNLSVAWSTIASKPTTLSGFGITDAVDGSGTTDYVPKWSDSNTLTDSVIRETGGKVGINTAPISTARLVINESQLSAPLRCENNLPSATGFITSGSFQNNAVNAGGTNYGVNTLVQGSTGDNIGVQGRATTTGTAFSIGAEFSAEGTTTNKFALRLIDGTQSNGKFLKCVNNDGRSNWANITVADVSNAVKAVAGTNNYIAKFTPDGTTIGNSLIQDNGTVGINVAPNASSILYINETTNRIPLYVTNTSTGGSTGNSSGGSFINSAVNSYENYGLGSVTSGSTTLNVAVSGRSTSVAGSVPTIGGVFSAEGSSTARHSVQLKDGTELAGKFLKCVNSDGKANWASLAISDVASLQTSLDAKSPLNPVVQTVTSSATVTPVSTNDLVTITAQAVGLSLLNPTGTFVEGQSLMIRIKDNGTAQTIAFGTGYRAIGITLPTTTVISKTMYLGIIYNSTDGKWDILGLNQQA